MVNTTVQYVRWLMKLLCIGIVTLVFRLLPQVHVSSMTGSSCWTVETLQLLAPRHAACLRFRGSPCPPCTPSPNCRSSRKSWRKRRTWQVNSDARSRQQLSFSYQITVLMCFLKRICSLLIKMFFPFFFHVLAQKMTASSRWTCELRFQPPMVGVFSVWCLSGSLWISRHFFMTFFCCNQKRAR